MSTIYFLYTRIFQILRKGLVKAARTTGAWIFTGGTNTGDYRETSRGKFLYFMSLHVSIQVLLSKSVMHCNTKVNKDQEDW